MTPDPEKSRPTRHRPRNMQCHSTCAPACGERSVQLGQRVYARVISGNPMSCLATEFPWGSLVAGKLHTARADSLLATSSVFLLAAEETADVARNTLTYSATSTDGGNRSPPGRRFSSGGPPKGHLRQSEAVCACGCSCRQHIAAQRCAHQALRRRLQPAHRKVGPTTSNGPGPKPPPASKRRCPRLLPAQPPDPNRRPGSEPRRHTKSACRALRECVIWRACNKEV